MDKFLKLFEGMDLTPEFQERLKAVFQEAIDAKFSASKEEEECDDCGMCEACKAKKAEMGEEFEMCEACKKKMAPPIVEAGEDPGLNTVDPMELVKDPDIRRILSALKINPMAFARSLKASIVDITGNMVGDDSFADLLTILDAIAQDSNLATRLAMDLKKKATEAPAEGEPTEPAMAEEEVEEEPVEEISEELIQNVDRYLSYVAEEWMVENKLAIESGLKTELVESFIGGLKSLFNTHNMEVPESVSVVEKLNQKIDKLTEDLNHAVENTITLKEELNSAKASAQKEILSEKVKNIFQNRTANLPATTTDKLKKLTETISYVNADEYTEKLNILVESVINEKKPTKKVLNEEDLQETQETIAEGIEDPKMKAYFEAISKNQRF